MNETLAHYLRSWWALNEFHDALFHLAWNVDRLLRSTPDLKDPPLLVQSSGNRLSVSTKGLLEQAQEIYTLLPRRRRQQRRRLRAAAAWAADPSQALQRLEEHQRRFDILLKRALRQRNAVIHGVPATPTVVAPVDRFVAQLAARVTSQTVTSAAERKPLAAALDRSRVEAQRKLLRLSDGKQSVVNILYA